MIYYSIIQSLPTTIASLYNIPNYITLIIDSKYTAIISYASRTPLVYPVTFTINCCINKQECSSLIELDVENNGINDNISASDVA